MELDFPLEFIVAGTPVSLQATRASSKFAWKALVRAASLSALPEGHFATSGRVSATMFYFPAGSMRGDIDNIVKLVLDALSQHIYLDDAQIERIVVQKFEPENVFAFPAPSEALDLALHHPRPVLYVRLSDDPFEDLS